MSNIENTMKQQHEKYNFVAERMTKNEYNDRNSIDCIS